MAGPLDLIEQGGRIGRAYGGGLLGGVQNAVQMWGHMQDRERQARMDATAEENRLREIRRQDESDARQRQMWDRQNTAYDRQELAGSLQIDRETLAQRMLADPTMTPQAMYQLIKDSHNTNNQLRQSYGKSPLAGPRLQLDEATQGMQDAFGGQQAYNPQGGLLGKPVNVNEMAPGGASFADIEKQPGLLGGLMNNDRNRSALLSAGGYQRPPVELMQIDPTKDLYDKTTGRLIQRGTQEAPKMLEVGGALYDPTTKTWLTPPQRPLTALEQAQIRNIESQIQDRANGGGSGGMTAYQQWQTQNTEQQNQQKAMEAYQTRLDNWQSRLNQVQQSAQAQALKMPTADNSRFLTPQDKEYRDFVGQQMRAYQNTNPKPQPPSFTSSQPSGQSGGGVPKQLTQWSSLVGAAANKHGVPVAVLYAVMERETGGRNIRGDGGHGRGLMQIDDRFHQDFLRANKEGMDPASNINYAAGMLANNFRTFGDWKLALAAYNGGGGNVQKAIRQGIDPDRYTTNNYGKSVYNRAVQFGLGGQQNPQPAAQPQRQTQQPQRQQQQPTAAAGLLQELGVTP